VAARVVVLLGAIIVHGESAHCDKCSSPSSLFQVDSGVHGRLGFIRDPVSMSDDEMADVDTTGMVKKTSGELTFYAYSNEQDQYVSASIGPNSYWEKDKSDEFCREYGKLAGKANFLDVGANIGTWSIPMAQCLRKLNQGGSVIAVEALGRNAKRLAASAHANSLDNIELFNYAVGEGGRQDQTVETVVEGNMGHSNLFSDSSDSGVKKSVSMTTLDEILKDRMASKDSRIFAMKMDIENYELYALQGAQNLLLSDHRPCLIFIELRVKTHEPSAKAMKLLEDNGYQTSEIGPADWDHLMRQKDFTACAQRFMSA